MANDDDNDASSSSSLFSVTRLPLLGGGGGGGGSRWRAFFLRLFVSLVFVSLHLDAVAVFTLITLLVEFSISLLEAVFRSQEIHKVRELHRQFLILIILVAHVNIRLIIVDVHRAIEAIVDVDVVRSHGFVRV